MNEEQLELHNNRPSWDLFNYGIAVFIALFASIALLFKRKMAVLLSLISLKALFIFTGYHLNTGAWNMMNVSDQFFFILIPSIGIVIMGFCP
jgi:hypothetical protein